MSIIKNAMIVDHGGGYSSLRFEYDGRQAEVSEPKMLLLERAIVVLLDGPSTEPSWEDTVSTELPGDPADNRQAMTIRGAVNDADLAALVRAYLALETVQPGPFSITVDGRTIGGS
jgi:hypothetical protein